LGDIFDNFVLCLVVKSDGLNTFHILWALFDLASKAPLFIWPSVIRCG